MDRDSILLKIGKETSIILTGFILGTVFQYLYKMMLARSLGPASFGVFVQGLGIVQTAAMFSLAGLHLSIPHFVSFRSGKDKSVEKIVSAAMYMIIAASTVISILLFVAAEPLAVRFFEEPELVTPLKIFAFTLVPLSGIYLVNALFRGRQDALAKIIIDDFIWSGAIVLAVLISILIGAGVSGAVYAYFAATLLTSIVAVAIYRKKSEHGLSRTELPFKKLALFTWPLFLIAIFTVLNRWFDVLMLGWFGDSAQAGIYDVAFSIAGYVALLSNSLGFIFMPVISELYGKQAMEKIRNIYSVSTRWLITLTLPILSGVLIFPEEIIRLLFGSQYISGKLSLMLLSVGFFLKVSRGPSSMILLASGKTKQLLTGSAVIAFTIISLNYLLIPEFGMIGAAFSTLTAYVLGDGIILLLTANELGEFPYSLEFFRILPPIIISSSAVYILDKIVDPGLALSVLMGVFLVSIYILLLYMFEAFQREDYRILRMFIESLNS